MAPLGANSFIISRSPSALICSWALRTLSMVSMSVVVFSCCEYVINITFPKLRKLNEEVAVRVVSEKILDNYLSPQMCISLALASRDSNIC